LSNMLALLLGSRDLATSSLLGLTAGYTTANTKVRFNTFGGMMTGNTVKLGMSLQAADWGWAGVYFCSILAFAIGTVFALFMIQKLGSLRSQQAFLFIFCAAFALVDGLAAAVDLTPEDYNLAASFCSTLAAFALGAQNILSQKSGVVKNNTTFMTGNIQKMAEAGWNHFTKKGGLKPAEKRTAILLALTWISYVLGGVIGAAIAKIPHFHWSLTPISIFYAIGMASMQVEPPKPATTTKPAAKDAAPAAGPSAVVVVETPSTPADAKAVPAV